jgi:hypothetical protein
MQRLSSCRTRDTSSFALQRYRAAGWPAREGVIDAEKLMKFVGNPELRPIAEEASLRLQAVLERI